MRMASFLRGSLWCNRRGRASHTALDLTALGFNRYRFKSLDTWLCAMAITFVCLHCQHKTQETHIRTGGSQFCIVLY